MIDDQGFLVHRRPFSDSRYQVNFLTRDHGLVQGMLRTRTKDSSLHHFAETSLSWNDSKRLIFFSRYEIDQLSVLQGESLYAGMYLNELVTRTVHTDVVIDGLFDVYRGTIAELKDSTDLEPPLRNFERQLLKGLGFEIRFDYESSNDNPIQPQRKYRYVSETGFTHLPNDNSEGISGGDLLAVASHNYSTMSARRTAKLVLQSALKPLLGEKPLLSRSLFDTTQVKVRKA